jgi:hypothetical protein
MSKDEGNLLTEIRRCKNKEGEELAVKVCGLIIKGVCECEEFTTNDRELFNSMIVHNLAQHARIDIDKVWTDYKNDRGLI